MTKVKSRIKSLYELCEYLGLSSYNMLSTEVFTIHSLKELGFTVPYTSPVFHPDYFSFALIRKGEGSYVVDGHRFEVSSKSIYFTIPCKNSMFSWTDFEDICLITFDEKFLLKYVGENVYDSFPFLLTEIIAPQKLNKTIYPLINTLFLAIKNEFSSNSKDKLNVIGHLFALLLYRIKHSFLEDYDFLYTKDRGSHIVKNFKQTLDRHYRHLVSGQVNTVYRVLDYALEQNLTANHLNSVVKERTGKTVSIWIRDKTIAEAKLLLNNSEMSIKEISYCLGFSETAHFTNFFKRHVSIPPLKYRKQL